MTTRQNIENSIRDFSGKNESFYEVKGSKFFSKMQALEEAKGDLNKITFRWFDSVWDSVDWSQEPKKTFKQLVKERCLMLREKHSHISLLYSGGYDSHTILTSFLENNIRLDRIIIFTKDYYDNSYDYAYGLQFAQYVKKYYQPWLEIWNPVLGQKDLPELYKSLGEEWIYYNNQYKMGKSQSYHLTEKYNKEFAADKIKNSIWIHGTDKPTLDFRDGKYYARMHDGKSFDYLYSQKIIPFYYSHDFVDLYVKQCWLAVNYYEDLNEEITNSTIHSTQSHAFSGEYYRKYNLALGRECLNHPTALYKSYVADWGGSIENVKESINLVTYSKKHDEKTYDYFKKGVSIVEEKILPLYNCEKIPTILGKSYFIKTAKVKTYDQN